jgi:hypothetical protein
LPNPTIKLVETRATSHPLIFADLALIKMSPISKWFQLN